MCVCVDYIRSVPSTSLKCAVKYEYSDFWYIDYEFRYCLILNNKQRVETETRCRRDIVLEKNVNDSKKMFSEMFEKHKKLIKTTKKWQSEFFRCIMRTWYSVKTVRDRDQEKNTWTDWPGDMGKETELVRDTKDQGWPGDMVKETELVRDTSKEKA